MTEGKVCTTCREFKFFTDYHKNKTRAFGYNSQCNQCRKPVKQLHYQNNKEKYKQSYQEFMKRNPDYHKKNNALIKNIS